jgi:hypothetical protein
MIRVRSCRTHIFASPLSRVVLRIAGFFTVVVLPMHLLYLLCRWDFDYVFFTESDQILISRELPLMYAHLKQYPG